jgi:hypothetical protein
MAAHANSRRRRRWAILLLAGLSSAAPLAAQQAAAPAEATAPSGGAPKSLLPDDIATPTQPVPGTVEGAVPAQPSTPQPLPGFEPLPSSVAEALPPEQPEEETKDPLAELAGPTMAPERAGLLTEALGGYRPDLFTGSDDRFLATLLARIDAPLASRWAQILLQRALLTVSDAPGPMNPADWVAARGAALVAVGAGADAHRLVSRISVDRYTQRLYGAAAQAALASGDPMALCPLSPLARLLMETPTWDLTDAMCLAILGDEVGAAGVYDRLRRKGLVSAFDIGLAERIASATGSGRRGANPEWSEATGGLTAWRIGLASAAGLEIPDDRLEAATPVQKAWLVRLPGQTLARRAAWAPEVAATGALSSAEIDRILAAEAAGLDPSAASDSPGGLLRTASIAPDVPDRIAALKSLWGEAKPDTAARYGWLVATAPAAARLPASSGLSADAPDITASLLAAGITMPAARWWRAVDGADSAVKAAVWARLVAAAPAVPMDDGLFDAWAKTVPAHRAQLLAAGLAGLGRGKLGPDIAPITNDWTRALARAVAARRSGEVILLAATGLQGQWANVPPDYLRQIAAALTAVGHAPEARLIVAEAATRG